jgi:hypothetical protein
VEALSKGPWIRPIASIVFLSRRSTTANENESDQDKPDNRDNLQTRGIEFGLAEYPHGKEVNDAGYTTEQRDSTGDGDLIAPVRQDDTEGSCFDGKNGYPTAPVLPANSETKSLCKSVPYATH